MDYNLLLFLLISLPFLLVLYQVVPQRHRWKLLLIASYIFFYIISGKLVIYIMASTFSIHYIGLWLETYKKDFAEKKKTADNKAELKALYAKKQKLVLCLGILLNIGLLLFLKYFNFFGENLNGLLNLVSSPVLIPKLKLAVPIGISFYTLEAVSYIVDVYRGRVEADRNIGRLALFLAFFPLILEGPICRYSETAEALYEGKPLDYKNVKFGAQRALWGLFKMFVLAYRLNMLVETVFNNYRDYSGIVVIVGAVFYTFQLYMDFSGCIDIAIGIGEMFGVTISENFRQPFFSKTASEFWRRWHITLGTWFKDYIFYPVSLTKFIKNLGKFTRSKFGKHFGQVIPTAFALFAVWISNGLWHGTGWNYIFFGLYYFAIILLGNIFEPLVEKITSALKINREAFWYRILQTLKILPIIFTGELFFRASRFKAGLYMFKSIFTGFSLGALTDGSLLKLKLTPEDFVVILIGFVIVLVVGILHEKGISIRERVAGWNVFFRWSFYYAVIMIIIIFGAYGEGYLPAKMIYAGF